MEAKERYETIGMLGQGGLGSVFEGYDHELQRKVAIKRLLANGLGGEEEIEALMHECRSLSALDSPHIVSLLDVSQDEKGPFAVMEFLDGETLGELASRATLFEQDFIKVAEQCLEGLLCAHQNNILHCDIKPCNIIITWLPDGQLCLKILDFGLAKFSLEHSKDEPTQKKSLLGSVHFMAPEQFEKLPHGVSTDLYSMGAVFYYTLAGVYPFDGESTIQVMAAHLQSHLTDLREHRDDLSEELCAWVMSLISRDPKDRPDSCSSALKQLRKMRK